MVEHDGHIGSPPLSGRPSPRLRPRVAQHRTVSSPSLTGWPFIEAGRAGDAGPSALWSPPLSGRPFIEACGYSAPCHCWSSRRPLADGPLSRLRHRRAMQTMRWTVAAPERAALHRGSQPPAITTGSRALSPPLTRAAFHPGIWLGLLTAILEAARRPWAGGPSSRPGPGLPDQRLPTRSPPRSGRPSSRHGRVGSTGRT
jgi:hypothetical protein